MLKKLILLSLITILVFSLVGCNEEANNDVEDAVAIVNGEEISREKFDSLVDQQKIMISQQQEIDFESEDGKEMLGRLEEYVLENLIVEKVLIQEAREMGYEVTKEDVEKELEEIIFQFGSEEEFEELLKENNIELDELKETINNEMIVNEYVENELDEIKVSEEEAKAIYDQYKEGNQDMPDFEDIKEQIIEDTKRQKREREISKLIDDLVENSDIEKFI